jgi:hypothetical protein
MKRQVFILENVFLYMRKNIAPRHPAGRLNRQARLNASQRYLGIIKGAQKIFQEIKNTPTEERANFSIEQRRRLKRSFGARDGDIEKILLELAVQEHPEFSGKAVPLSEATGISKARIRKRLSSERKRPKIDRVEIKRGFYESIRGATGQELVEKSKKIRNEFAKRFHVKIEEINRIILESLLRNTELSLREISEGTGINRKIVELHEAKFASFAGTATRTDTRNARSAEVDNIIHAAESVVEQYPKKSYRDLLEILRTAGFKNPKKDHLTEARRNLRNAGKIGQLRGAYTKQIERFILANPNMPPKQVYELLSFRPPLNPERPFPESEELISQTQVENIRRRLIRERKVPNLQAPPPPIIGRFILANSRLTSREAFERLVKIDKTITLGQVDWTKKKLIRSGKVPSMQPSKTRNALARNATARIRLGKERSIQQSQDLATTKKPITEKDLPDEFRPNYENYLRQRYTPSEALRLTLQIMGRNKGKSKYD